MSPEGKPSDSQRVRSVYYDFIKMLGRAMGQISLYGVNHPSVKESVKQSYDMLVQILAGAETPGLTLSLSEDAVLANGFVLFGMDKMPSSVLSIFRKYSLQSITFRKNVSESEILAFCELAGYKPKVAEGAAGFFLKEKQVVNISINEAVYTKIGEGQSVGSGGEGGEAPAQESLSVKIAGKSVEDSLNVIVGQMGLSPEEQRKVMDVVMEQLHTELASKVQEATAVIKQDKKRVENEKAVTESVVNANAEGMIVVDAAGKILMMNSVAEQIFGKRFPELSGKSIMEIEGAKEQFLAVSKDFSAPGDKDIAPQVNLKGADEAVNSVRRSTAIIKNDSGNIVGSTSIPADIAKLRETEKLQQEFIANVTHELRSPLTSITAALDILSGSLKSKIADENMHFLNTAIRNAQRLNSLISDILDFSKLKSGKLTVHPDQADAVEIAKEAVDSMQSWARSRGQALVLEPGSDIPIVYADKARTVQVLLNLISNAIKFTPERGKIIVSLSSRSSSSGEFVVFAVKDSGPGINPKNHTRIFERFEQVASGADHPGGTGLGLPITKALVLMQHGKMELDSVEGKGSEFRVLLPVDITSPAAQPRKDSQPKSWLSRLFGK